VRFSSEIQNFAGMAMIRFQFVIAVAAGVMAAGTMALAASPEAPRPAQARAEQACRDQGVRPPSAAWELCLSHVTRAYEWGENTLAKQLAHAAGDARENCLDYGLAPEGSAYRACIGREIEARSQLLILGDDQSGVNVAQQ
jgi:hypothetical protein